MLFPNSEVRMRPIDKVIIGSSALIGGAVVLVTKLGASLLLLFALFTFWGGFSDKVIIGSSALIGGAVVLVTKLGASLLLLFTLFTFWGGFSDKAVTMTQQHFITLAIGIGVFGSFVFKEWSKFKNRKIKFMKNNLR